MTRRYELKQRAQRQAQTRHRIVEATVELHGSVGPARTTISAIAERAGVERLTVYRHFPDDRSLFQACSGHWAIIHPRPDHSRWAAVSDPEERLRVALCDVYAYFRATESMSANVRRDLPELPVLQEVAVPFAQYWQTAHKVLDRGWKTRGHRRQLVRAVIAHALDFETWRSLARSQELEDTEVADLMTRLAQSAQT